MKSRHKTKCACKWDYILKLIVVQVILDNDLFVCEENPTVSLYNTVNVTPSIQTAYAMFLKLLFDLKWFCFISWQGLYKHCYSSWLTRRNKPLILYTKVNPMTLPRNGLYKMWINFAYMDTMAKLRCHNHMRVWITFIRDIDLFRSTIWRILMFVLKIEQKWVQSA